MENLLIMTTFLVKINPIQSQVSVLDITELFSFILGRHKYVSFTHISQKGLFATLNYFHWLCYVYYSTNFPMPIHCTDVWLREVESQKQKLSLDRVI